MPTITTANTSVVLVDTASANPPYIVYFTYNNNVGGIITVRDNDGYASTGNPIILSTFAGTTKFHNNNNSTILINQPFGFITLSVQPDGAYSILNTFAFPTGSDSAYVYSLNTNNLKIQDSVNTGIFNSLTTSGGLLYYNSGVVGNVTNTILTNSINNLSNNISHIINQTTVTRSYIGVGIGNPGLTPGTIQFSDDLGINWYNAIQGTRGFINGGIDISVDNAGYFVACGDNSSINPRINSTNLGYIQWSFDGKSWFNSTSPLLSKSQIRNRVHFASGIWHAVGSDLANESILWSTDRQVWNASVNNIIFNQPSIYNSIAYNKNIWVACGSNNIQPTNDSYSLIWSSDGSNWNLNDINNNSSYFYDIVYTGTKFVTLLSNVSKTNIIISSTGSNNWINTNTNLNNESGYLGTNNTITIVLTNSYHKYSINNGISWTDMTNFPIGIPSRPYYDGSAWWVGMQNNTYNTYTSSDGINWSPYINSGSLNLLFPNNGYLTALVSVNVSSNLNIQLISTVYGLEHSFNSDSLQTKNLSVSSFTFRNTFDNTLSITNNTTNGILSVNNISTSYIQTDNFITKGLSINDLNVNTLNVNIQENAVSILASSITASTFYTTYSYNSTIFASTIYISDMIETPLINTNYISSSLANISSLVVINDINTSYILANSIDVNNLNVSTATISTLTASTSILNLVYADIISTNTAIVSTIQLKDYDGSERQLYTYEHNLYFDGNIINTNVTNPLYFRYTLIDVTGATPASTQFSITTANSSGNLNDMQTINISVQDLSSKILYGFFNNVAINSVLHLINTTLSSDHIYRINSIQATTSADSFLLNVTLLSGNNQNARTNIVYNMFIESIGIPPPINASASIITVNAKASATKFDLTSANVFVTIPSNIGTYIQGTTNGSQFGINLNNNNYSLSHIPALIGSIVYFNGGSYVVANVKCGSISATNGAYITIDNGVQTITVSGLTLTNFPSAVNDINGYALYITLQFLN